MTALNNTKPAVFYFQPTEFKMLESPEEIKRWEHLMRESVGIKSVTFDGSGSCCESPSGNPSRADDCDQD
ncbi:hypothetical protein JI735_19675 [Paenibacillus sonchi]|uniref:Uncharacterized protein n=1 Tax=Paenibacillus sonchi TaxID=373687 RepID=A0A974P7U9_9BACL|nr:hypothetical protein [Paenibacillus sonchi]MCE3203425.1 hypothetical protein [Paenibacillus sonchi]QQZ58950.1 hypothetical protein JI735_19675 [Paenibacillus sonchi]